MAYSTGIIQGVDSTGKFEPKASMTRAQAATVLCRLYDLLETLPDFEGSAAVTPDIPEAPETPETPDVPETPETPETSEDTTTPAGNYGPVGTVSDSIVTLHYSTHAPTVDYWTDAPQWIKDKTDKDAFNALAQTLLDPENAAATETIDRVSRNPYYNYAVYEQWGDNDKAYYVTGLFNILRNFKFEQAVWNPAVATGSNFFIINHYYETRNERDFEFLNKVNDSMSDREVMLMYGKEASNRKQ